MNKNNNVHFFHMERALWIQTAGLSPGVLWCCIMDIIVLLIIIMLKDILPNNYEHSKITAKSLSQLLWKTSCFLYTRDIVMVINHIKTIVNQHKPLLAITQIEVMDQFLCLTTKLTINNSFFHTRAMLPI